MKGLKRIGILVGIIAVAVGLFFGVSALVNKAKKYAAKERAYTMEKTLRELGNESLGGTDANTAQYSMALSYVEEAALGEGYRSHSEGLDAAEVKRVALEYLTEYFESDYEKSYACMVLGADYFSENDIEIFYNGTKVNVANLEADFTSILANDGISLSTLLIDEEDEKICYTVSLKIKLAGAGYLPVNEIIDELEAFVYEGKAVRTVSDELLEKKVTMEQIGADMAGSLTGTSYRYAELSPVGKMVFTYLMPRLVVQVDKESGSWLWNYRFKSVYEELWNEIIHRDIFSEIIVE